MKRQILGLLRLASVGFFVALSPAAFAQQAGTVTQNAFAIGVGSGKQGYASLLCGAAQLAVGQSAAAPICQTITGDVTINASGVTAIGTAKVVQAMIALNAIDNTRLATMANGLIKCRTTAGTGNPEDCTAAQIRTILALVIGTNVEAWDADLDCLAALSGTGIIRRTGAGTCSNGTAIANSELATMGAYTLKGNATGSAATPTDIDPTALTLKSAPGTSDIVIIQDVSASNQFKKTTVGALSTAGSVASLNGLTGAVTTNMVVQPFTAGAGTYTYTPTAGMLHAVMECVGSGAGGGSAAGISGGTFGGGGGGSGSYSRKTVTAAQVGATATIVIGASGAGGASGSNNGANGSAVTITSAASVLLLQANGGNGGKFGSSVSATSGVAGAGAASGTGDIIAQGSPGGHGIYANNTTTLFPSGDGASSAWGGGALGVSGAGVATAGTNAGNYGAGGSGGEAQATTSNAAGGNGSAGACFITDFVNL